MSEPGKPTPQAMLAELAELAAAAADVVVPSSIQDATRSLTSLALRFFGAAACSIAILDEDEEELHYVAASGAGSDAIIGVRLPTDRGIAGWVAQSGQPIAISDLNRDVRFARDVAESTSYVPRTLMVVPIETGERLLGVLSVLDRDETRPDAADDLSAAADFAAQAAAALEAEQAFADVGRILLQGLARAAGEGATLGATLAMVTPARSPGLDEFAALLAEVYRSGPAERRLAVQLLSDVLTYANRRQSGLGGPPSPTH